MFLDLLYLAWPYWSRVILAPLSAFFWLSDQIMSGLDQQLGSLLWVGFSSAVVAAGLVFLERFSWKVLTNRQQRPGFGLSRSTWLLLWLLQTWVGWSVAIVAQPAALTLKYENLAYLYLAAWLLGLGSLLVFLFQAGVTLGEKLVHLHRRQPHWLAVERLVTMVSLVVLSYPFLTVGTGLVWIFLDPTGQPQASRFFPIHAIAQNRCYLDEDLTFCPRNLEEYRQLEPANFDAIMANTQAQYWFDENRGQFVLAIRYAPNRVVVFDRRFLDSTGLDFQEMAVNPVTNRLKNAPDFLELRQFPDWEY